MINPENAIRKRKTAGILLPVAVLVGFILLWFIVSYTNLFPAYALPSPASVVKSFKEEFQAGRLVNDIIASLWRVAVGFVLSAALGIPLGLWLGQHVYARKAFVPMLNFFRFLSPLAWIPFAILWFHIGDKPAIFLIFMATFFPLALATMSAVATIPSIYFRVAKEYNYTGWDLLTKVTFPSVLPQVITALRVSYGISWVVIVAAEMVGCQDGLGYGIWEARNGLRLDSAVCYMIVIGVLGMGIDRLLAQLTKLPNVRWGYER
ncbi:MAG: ABC transporter permease [Chitinophagaceae bacterium]|nr:ABC transporter permease [Chitinophagaceae bacterium]